MAPCSGCYHNLKKAEYDLAHDAPSREVTANLAARAGHASTWPEVETLHVLEWIKRTVGEAGLGRVQRGLAGLQVANYYGCMYTRRSIFPERIRARARVDGTAAFHGRPSRRRTRTCLRPEDACCGVPRCRFGYLDAPY